MMVDVTVFTTAMSSLMLFEVSVTKQRALLDPLEIPTILKVSKEMEQSEAK